MALNSDQEYCSSQKASFEIQYMVYKIQHTHASHLIQVNFASYKLINKASAYYHTILTKLPQLLYIEGMILETSGVKFPTYVRTVSWHLILNGMQIVSKICIRSSLRNGK